MIILYHKFALLGFGREEIMTVTESSRAEYST